MTYCIYLTTNKATGEYYKGKSAVKHVENGYQGSGTRIAARLKADAPGTWTTKIVAVFSSERDAYDAEANYITLADLKNPLCMNLCLGGARGKSWTTHRDYQRYVYAIRMGAEKYPVATAALELICEQHFIDKKERVEFERYLKSARITEHPPEDSIADENLSSLESFLSIGPLDDLLDAAETPEEQQEFEAFVEDAYCWPIGDEQDTLNIDNIFKV